MKAANKVTNLDRAMYDAILPLRGREECADAAANVAESYADEFAKKLLDHIYPRYSQEVKDKFFEEFKNTLK